MDFKNLTIKNFHEGLIKKEFSAVEITEFFFDYIKEKDEKIKAYLSLGKENALNQAKQADLSLSEGKNPGVLAGVPLAIKDNILIEGRPCTAASKILENYQAAYDATVIKKLKTAGSVFLGKTNLDEFAMGSSTENSAFQITRNPADLEKVPGGSSGGSAAAVASGMAIAALGSDTGGSIRQPASFCGVVGLKPTYGAVSRYGLIAMASSLDQIGPITKTVEDAEILFDAIKGKDPMDSTSVEFKLKTQNSKLKTLTIGLPEEYFIKGLDKKTTKAIDGVIKNLEGQGFKFKKISLPHTKYALSCYYIIMPAEASTNLARYDGIRYSRLNNISINQRGNQHKSALNNIYFNQRSGGFGKEVKRRIILGTFVLSSGYYDSYYLKAQKVRRLIKEDFDKAFEEVDVILTPVSPTPAFKIGEKTDNPLEMYLSDIFTIPVNLAGLPAISIPARINADKCGLNISINQRGNQHKSALPIGFQLIGKHFRETDILEIGKLYEKSL
ncbi:MAG: Asp-tRNA(Asn)/Glu-tRNA(Gln) amidotransferase subunit GatA [bacterium]|nr:Asp-tRNA(Asn)/Glu-tRNA(Gln) amidotransferase subunit GatA [bacterium]